MKKVALIQNRIQLGGRFQVMAEMILVLNNQSIVPDVLCFRSSVDVEKAKDFYGSELKFNLVKVPSEFTMPFEWNIYWFNRKVSYKLGGYDLVINHNNTSYGLSGYKRLLSYMHFPRKDRLFSGLRDMHSPEKGEIPFVNARKDLFNLIRWFYKFDKQFNANEVLVANSEFTKKALLKVYKKLTAKRVEVLYPPVQILEKSKPLGAKYKLVSLGRIASAKRQLEQIKIAEQLPSIELTIIGFVSEEGYHEQCLAYIKYKKLKNVVILANATKVEVTKTLSEAAFFIHCMRNEPFGITPVQAITNGCLPIVHDSGGQKEVVPFEKLRYESVNDAAKKLTNLMHLNTADLETQLKKLQEHILEYDAVKFRKRFSEMLLSLQA